jgi:hypothetical protein
MSKKYIRQVINQNFVYPNNEVSEYDIDIIHDINNNSVSGTVNSFSATTFTTSNITINWNITWNLNGAEPWIRNSNSLGIASLHMLAPGQDYYKPWRVVSSLSNANINLTTLTTTITSVITPSQVGLTSFTSGTYYFEVRFIGHRSIYPVCVSLDLTPTTPTPTPTTTPTFTPTPTRTPDITTTPTPTPTPTFTPTQTITPTLNCATLNWSFTENNAQGTMDLFVNAIVVESRSITSSGNYTVCVGDTINVQVYCDQCIIEPNLCANAYSISDKPVLTDANCNCSGPTSILTSIYTVTAGDVGTTINLSTFATCNVGCV